MDLVGLSLTNEEVNQIIQIVNKLPPEDKDLKVGEQWLKKDKIPQFEAWARLQISNQGKGILFYSILFYSILFYSPSIRLLFASYSPSIRLLFYSPSILRMVTDIPLLCII